MGFESMPRAFIFVSSISQSASVSYSNIIRPDNNCLRSHDISQRMFASLVDIFASLARYMESL